MMPNITINTIQLPPDLVWEDEVSWSPRAKTETRSVTGVPILQGQAKVGGRRISLASGSDYAWVTRGAILALMALRDSDATMTLTLGDGRDFTVTFAPESETPIEAVPIQPGKNPATGDYYTVKLRFMEMS